MKISYSPTLEELNVNNSSSTPPELEERKIIKSPSFTGGYSCSILPGFVKAPFIL